MFGRMIPNPKSFVELFQKWPTGGISLQKWFRHFPVHGFLSENQDAVMMKFEKRNHIKTVLGIQKIFSTSFRRFIFQKIDFVSDL